MVMPKYIDENIELVQYGNAKKGSCRMEEVEARLGVSQQLDEQNA